MGLPLCVCLPPDANISLLQDAFVCAGGGGGVMWRPEMEAGRLHCCSLYFLREGLLLAWLVLLASLPQGSLISAF